MKLFLITTLITFGILGCATESHNTIQTDSVLTKNKPYEGPKYNLVVGKFDNRSSFERGIFSDGEDRLGSQAKTILMTHLEQTGHFYVLDRTNMERSVQEAQLSKVKQDIKGANIVVTGNVTEFGRKVVGDKQLFGILGRGSNQIAYAKVMLNVVDIKSSVVIYSVEAAGEYNLSNREVIGFGGTAGYDSTLNGKVLNLAIREAVDKMVQDVEHHKWGL